jgi:hypothetical protein
MQHGFADQNFKTYNEIKKWLDEWFPSKNEHFFYREIHLLPKKWEKIVANDTILNKI